MTLARCLIVEIAHLFWAAHLSGLIQRRECPVSLLLLRIHQVSDAYISGASYERS
jgi:hypothetical protein